VTLTGDGGTANTSSIVSGSAIVGSDRKAVINGTMKSESGNVGAVDTSGGAILAVVGKTVTIKPTLTATATGKRGDTITLTGKNFEIGAKLEDASGITFGGKAITAANTEEVFPLAHKDKDADTFKDDFSIKFTIPSDATKGSNQVKVTDDDGIFATATVEVEASSIVLSATSGPPGTKIIISGAGFPKSRDSNNVNKISISPDWDGDGLLTPGFTESTGLFTDSAGALPGSDSITIPKAAEKTVVTVKVTIVGADGASATATAKFTVGSRELTVTPASGPMGTKVLVSGSKFSPAGIVDANTITVDGETSTHGSITMTSSGDVPNTELTIPDDVTLGMVTVSLNESSAGDLTGTVKFDVTQPTLATDLGTASMGTDVTVLGTGWVPGSSTTITLKLGTTTLTSQVTTIDSEGGLSQVIRIPANTGVGPDTVTFTATDTKGNSSTAVNLSVPSAKVSLSSGSAAVGDVITVMTTGFPPQSGLSTLEIGGADVRGGVVTSNIRGELETTFIVPGLTGSQLVTVKIGDTQVSTSLTVTASTGPVAADTTAPVDIFADVIANSDNLVRVWRFDNATQSWQFYDPRPAFSDANTLEKSGAGDIVWVNVKVEQAFQDGTLFPGWNLISLN
jgi:hypothetical protein